MGGPAQAVRALRELERRTADAGGLVLRFGHLTGPRHPSFFGVAA